MAKTIRVWEVLVDTNGAGPAGDGTIVRRFRSEKEAKSVASSSTCYGRPAEAKPFDAPRRLAERWGLA